MISIFILYFIFHILYIAEKVLQQAYKKAKSWKNHNKEIQDWINHEETNIQNLYHDLIFDKYKIWKPTMFMIQDPVLREIICVPFRDRIVQHIIHQALYPLVENQAYHDVYSNMVWRWNLYGVKRVSRFLRSCSKNFRQDCRILKLDIQNFFLSINKQILWEKTQKLVSEKYFKSNRYDWPWLMKIINQIIFYDYRDYTDLSIQKLREKFPYRKSMYSSDWTHGLPLGNLTSQLFANIYMHGFDVFVKENLWIQYYGRYVDDFILIHEDKNYLIECREKVREFLQNELKLTLHPKKVYLQHYSKWVRFLWVMIYPHYRTLGRKTIYRANQKMENLDKQKEPYQSRMSYDWLAKHHKNRHLRQNRAIQYRAYELSKILGIEKRHLAP